MQGNESLSKVPESGKSTATSLLMMALVSGSGFAALVTLLLGMSLFAPLSAVLTFFLLPGGMVVDFFVHAENSGPPLLVLAANSFTYSVVAYVGFSTLGKTVSGTTLRLALTRLVLPAVILVGLACIPTLNPLWPRRMTELGEQEQALRAALPLGIGLDAARLALRSRGIAFGEWSETSDSVLLERDESTVRASAGDWVISTRLETDAEEFPCGYDIEVVLVFGADHLLRGRYIRRLRLCP